MNKFLHAGFVAQGHSDLREKMNTMKMDFKSLDISKLVEIALEMKERRRKVPIIDKITWYYRHWGKDAVPGV